MIAAMNIANASPFSNSTSENFSFNSCSSFIRDFILFFKRGSIDYFFLKWQATKCCGSISTHSGFFSRQISIAYLHLVWNLHPFGGLTGLGISPSYATLFYFSNVEALIISSLSGRPQSAAARFPPIPDFSRGKYPSHIYISYGIYILSAD